MKVSFVIPCYRSEKTIEEVVHEIQKVMHDEYEIILINDFSPDLTYRVICELCKKYSNIVGINLAKNFGQHAALMAGFRHVTGDVIICMDDDGQTPPSEVYRLLDAINADTDVVYARYEEKKHSAFRNFGSKMNSKMTQYLMDKPEDLYISSYFAAKRFVIDEISRYENPYPYVIGLILRTTKQIKNVDITHHDRLVGDSGYNMKKLIALWVNGFTAFSVKPLRIASILGVLCACLGFAYVLYTIINWFVNPNVPIGWSSLVAVTLIIGGSILMMLGLIGEYIGRIYISLNNAPQYVIRDVIGKDEASRSSERE